MSSAGADASSRIFYSRVKGEAERDLQALGFPTLGLYRPSLLDGQRSESRPGERIGLAVARALGPLLPAGTRPVRASAVARAMAAEAIVARPGTLMVPSKRIAQLGA